MKDGNTDIPPRHPTPVLLVPRPPLRAAQRSRCPPGVGHARGRGAVPQRAFQVRLCARLCATVELHIAADEPLRLAGCACAAPCLRACYREKNMQRLINGPIAGIRWLSYSDVFEAWGQDGFGSCISFRQQGGQSEVQGPIGKLRLLSGISLSSVISLPREAYCGCRSGSHNLSARAAKRSLLSGSCDPWPVFMILLHRPRSYWRASCPHDRNNFPSFWPVFQSLYFLFLVHCPRVSAFLETRSTEHMSFLQRTRTRHSISASRPRIIVLMHPSAA